MRGGVLYGKSPNVPPNCPTSIRWIYSNLFENFANYICMHVS